MRKLVAILVGAAVLLLTPYFLYRQINPEFDYGAAEMRAAIEGTWQAQLAGSDDDGPRNITFTIRQATAARQQHSQRTGLVRPAAACSHRTLVRSAEACLDVTDMALQLATVDGNVGDLSGRFLVVGTAFKLGSLELTIDGRFVSADISPAGDVLAHNDGVLALSRIGKPNPRLQAR